MCALLVFTVPILKSDLNKVYVMEASDYLNLIEWLIKWHYCYSVDNVMS